MIKETVDFSSFEKLDIRTGIVTDAKPFEGARRPAIKLWIDFGEEYGIKKSSAQITVHYKPEELIGRSVLAVVNFPPRQIGTFMSECLVLGAYDKTGAVVLLQTDKEVPPGSVIG